MRYSTITAKQRFELQTFLTSVCKADAAGVASYDRGWSDQKVADRFNVTTNIVSYARNQLIGPLFVKAPAPVPGPLPSSPDMVGMGGDAKALALALQRIARLEEHLDKLQKQFDDLENYLTKPQPKHGGLNGQHRHQ